MSKTHTTPHQVAAEAAGAGLIDPEQAAETQARTEIPAEPEEIHIDPQMLQQATANRNARLIAALVNENAMLEVALESERRDKNEWKSKCHAATAALAQLA